MTTSTPHGAMPELLDCPFCGAHGSVSMSGNHSHAWEGGCSNGDCIAFDLIWEASEAEAITAWNRRAAIQQAAVAVPEGLSDEAVRALWIEVRNKQLFAKDWDNRESLAVLFYRALIAASPTPPASGGSSDHLAACAGNRVQVPLLFSRRKGIADKLGMQMTPQFNAIVRAVELAHGIDWFPRPDAPPSQIKELSSNGGREGV